MSSNKPKQKRLKINLNEWKANVESLPEPHTYAVPDMKNLLEAARRRGNAQAVETMWKASKAATYGPTKYRKGSFNGATQRRRRGGKKRKTLKKNKRKVMRRKRKNK